MPNGDRIGPHVRPEARPARNADGPGSVYVMQNAHAPHLLKIGYATDPRKRLSTARLHAPEMQIIGISGHETIRTAERLVHKRLQDARAYNQSGFNEWFYADHPLVKEYLAELEPYDDPKPAWCGRRPAPGTPEG